MDPQIEELKELVRQSTALTQEVLNQVHKMRRGKWISSIVSPIMWIVISLVFSWIVYALFLQDYIAQFQEFIEQAQQQLGQFQNPNR